MLQKGGGNPQNPDTDHDPLPFDTTQELSNELLNSAASDVAPYARKVTTIFVLGNSDVIIVNDAFE